MCIFTVLTPDINCKVRKLLLSIVIIVKYMYLHYLLVMVKGVLRLRAPSTNCIVKSPEAPRFGRVGAVFQGNIQTNKTLKFVVCSFVLYMFFDRRHYFRSPL